MATVRHRWVGSNVITLRRVFPSTIHNNSNCQECWERPSYRGFSPRTDQLELLGTSERGSQNCLCMNYWIIELLKDFSGNTLRNSPGAILQSGLQSQSGHSVHVESQFLGRCHLFDKDTLLPPPLPPHPAPSHLYQTSPPPSPKLREMR